MYAHPDHLGIVTISSLCSIRWGMIKFESRPPGNGADA
jgi:hypothetical protein